jgi:hypothetical protein
MQTKKTRAKERKEKLKIFLSNFLTNSNLTMRVFNLWRSFPRILMITHLWDLERKEQVTSIT